MVLLMLNLLDVTMGTLSMVTALVGVWGRSSAALTVAGYSIYLVVCVVLVSSFGVMRQPGRACLTVSLWTTIPALLVEMAFVAVVAIDGRKQFVSDLEVDKDAPLGDAVMWMVGNLTFISLVAARHALRFLQTYWLRACRDGIVNGRKADERLEENDLNERLLQREARREKREDLRAHFNNKYFGGKTPDGKPTPPTKHERLGKAELPNYVLASHQRDPTDIESNRSSKNNKKEVEGGIDWDI